MAQNKATYTPAGRLLNWLGVEQLNFRSAKKTTNWKNSMNSPRECARRYRQMMTLSGPYQTKTYHRYDQAK